MTEQQKALLEKAERGLQAVRLLHENEQFEFAAGRACSGCLELAH